MQIKLFNETKVKISKKLIEDIENIFTPQTLKGLGSKQSQANKVASCNLIIQSKNAISRLNKELFNRKGTTDVISVNKPSCLPPCLRAQSGRSGTAAFSPQPSTSLGDIYICPAVIKQNAKKHDITFEEESARVIIHGILHLLGFEHKKPFGESKEKLFKIQEKLLDQLKKPSL